jgi:hypothetical protein
MFINFYEIDFMLVFVQLQRAQSNELDKGNGLEKSEDEMKRDEEQDNLEIEGKIYVIINCS